MFNKAICSVALFLFLITVAGCGVNAPKEQSFRESIPRLQQEIIRFTLGHDQDNDGMDDLDDFVQGAREYVAGGVQYKDGYYAGGYPPPGEGVCTDVIWAALQAGGYDFKAMVDKDIADNTADYPRVNDRPEPNIDFRRVKNLQVFFAKYADSLTIEVAPQDATNLKEWQGGDVVIYGAPLVHIAIVSDRRRADGVPLIIHNGGPVASEADMLITWPSNITGHYRFPSQATLLKWEEKL